MADFPEFLSQDSQDCTLLKTQTGGNNVPAGSSSAKVKTADFTSSMSTALPKLLAISGCGTTSATTHEKGAVPSS